MKMMNCEKCNKIIEKRNCKQRYCSPCNGIMSRLQSKIYNQNKREEKRKSIPAEEEDDNF